MTVIVPFGALIRVGPHTGSKSFDVDDLTVLVAFNDKPTPGPETEVYVIRTSRLVGDLNETYRHYHRHKNRDGSTRKRSSQRVIRLSGAKKPDNIAYGFRDDWKGFRDHWDLLDRDLAPA